MAQKLWLLCCIAFCVVQISSASDSVPSFVGFGSRTANRLTGLVRDAAAVARETVLDGFRTASAIGSRLGLGRPMNRIANVGIQPMRNDQNAISGIYQHHGGNNIGNTESYYPPPSVAISQEESDRLKQIYPDSKKCILILPQREVRPTFIPYGHAGMGAGPVYSPNRLGHFAFRNVG